MLNGPSFDSFGLDESLVNALKKHGFTHASAIQAETIKPILDGQDIFALAQTGSGKTGAFVIPLVQLLIKRADSHGLYIILSPTRELAQQTNQVFTDLTQGLGIKSVCLIGGEDIDKQIKHMEEVQVLIATPGRLNDLCKRKKVDLKNCVALVFDEADRLFDMGFKKEIEYVLNLVPKNRQLIMVSATSNYDVLNTAYKHHSQPLEIQLDQANITVQEIDDLLVMLASNEKMPYLVNLLRTHQDTYAVIFCNTQFQTHLVAEWLRLMGLKAKPISGRLVQNKRTSLMQEFRNKEVLILVCTDVAARGLDIDDVDIVINFDLPNEAANYVHRIGRTGRAGKSGKAISFCAFEDCEQLDAIEEYIKRKINKLNVSDDDFAKDLCQKPYIDAKTLKVVDRSQNNKTSKPLPNRQVKPVAKKIVESVKVQEPVQEKEGKPMQEQSYQDKRSFEISTYNKKLADRAAMQYLNISDTELLGYKVVAEGARQFFIFGKRKTTYQYYVKPIYKKLLTPFLEQVFDRMGLDLNFRVSYKDQKVNINIEGEDVSLIKDMRFDLQYAFEQIATIYLSQKIFLSKSVKVFAKIHSNILMDKKNLKERPETDNRKNGSLNRSSNGINEQELIALAEKTKKQILDTNKPVMLKSLNPAQRRIIHQHINSDPKFLSSSVGEGKFKRIEVSLR
jgi:superfamily II DNA/RNA helicase